MKNLICPLLCLSIVSLASCQKVTEQGYELTAKVEDDTGAPVADVQVQAVRIAPVPGAPVPAGKTERTAAITTGGDGTAVLAFRSLPTPEGSVTLQKPGYYESRYSTLSWRDAGAGSWKADLAATLKPIRNPIPMIARRSSGFILKEIGVEYGYDIEAASMVAPHGIGKHADLVTRLEGTRKDNGAGVAEDVEFRVVIRFSNPSDGFVEFERKEEGKGPVFESAYEAPAEGYQASLERFAKWGKARGTAAYWTSLHDDESKGYYFRVRTRTDADGQVAGGHYGKGIRCSRLCSKPRWRSGISISIPWKEIGMWSSTRSGTSSPGVISAPREGRW